MCKVVINKLMLGARELGYELWNGKEVVEMTSAQIKTSLKSGKSDIVGLHLDVKEDLQLDEKGYFMTNIMCKAHIGNFKPLVENDIMMMNVFYYVTKTEEKEGVILYHMISSRFARETVNAEKLLALYDLGLIAGGVKIDNEKIVAFDRPVMEKEKPVEIKVQAVKGAVKVKEEVKNVK